MLLRSSVETERALAESICGTRCRADGQFLAADAATTLNHGTISEHTSNSDILATIYS